MVAVERKGDSSCVFRICVIPEAIITVAFELTLFLGGIYFPLNLIFQETFIINLLKKAAQSSWNVKCLKFANSVLYFLIYNL
jgi:hypothetical protein